MPLLPDPNAGVGVGAMIVPASIMARNQSRADSRRAYLDPVLHRPNLHLAIQQTVTRILVGSNATSSMAVPRVGKLARAYGVEVRGSWVPSQGRGLTAAVYHLG